MVNKFEKLAVVNTGSDSISIIDINNGFEFETILLSENQPYLGPHQIINNEEGDIVYSANSYANSVFKINIDEKKVVDNLVIGSFPSHIDRIDNHLMVTNGDSNSISVIDEKGFQLLENIPVGEKPHDIKVHKRTKNIFVTNSNDYTIDVLNLCNKKIEKNEEIRLPFKPLHLSIGVENIYVLCPLNNGMINSKILELDIDTGELKKTIDIDGVINDMIVMEEKGVMYVTNIDDGFLYNVDTHNGNILDKFFLGGMPNTLISDMGKLLFITNILNNNLIVFDHLKSTIIKRIKLGEEPNGMLLM